MANEEHYTLKVLKFMSLSENISINFVDLYGNKMDIHIVIVPLVFNLKPSVQYILRPAALPHETPLKESRRSQETLEPLNDDVDIR